MPTERIPSRRSVEKTRTAISPRFATITVSNMSSLHPKDAVGRLAEGSVRTRAQCQGQNGARVEGIDDAVVPEPRGGIVRVALGLVALANGSAEGLLLLRTPLFAASLEL